MNQLHRDEGFTLVEVITSMVIITIIVIAFSMFFSNSMRNVSYNRERMDDINKASEELDIMLSPDAMRESRAHSISFNFHELAEPINILGAIIEEEIVGKSGSTTSFRTFLADVAVITSLSVEPERHTYGQEPDSIEIEVDTRLVEDGDTATVQFADQHGNVYYEVNGIINGNHIELNIDMNNPEVDMDIPEDGIYRIGVSLDQALTSSEIDYIIRPIRLVAVGDGGSIITSSEGISWGKQVSTVTDDINAVVNGGTPGNQKFIAVGDNGIVLSSELGKNWSKVNAGITEDLHDVIWGLDRFIAVGDSGTIITSQNGETWQKEDLGATVPDKNLKAAAFGGNKQNVIIVGDHDSTPAIIYDGDDFTQLPNNLVPDLVGVAYADDIFVAVGNERIVSYSEDDVEKYVNRPGLSADINNFTFKDVYYGDGSFLTYFAVGINNLTAQGNIYALAPDESTGSMNWYEIQNSNDQWNAITFSNVGSLNGIVWMDKTMFSVGTDTDNDGSVLILKENGEYWEWDYQVDELGLSDVPLNDITSR